MNSTDEKTGRKASKHRAFGIFLNIELILMAILFCTIVLPKSFGIIPDVVLSNSMSSSAPVGSIAYLNANASPDNLQVGDIAAYQAASDVSVLHRVHAVNDDGTFAFKGDANDSIDEASPTGSEILGTYLFCIPYAGYIYMWVADHAILTIAALLAANVLVYAISNPATRSGNKALSLADKVPVETKG